MTHRIKAAAFVLVVVGGCTSIAGVGGDYVLLEGAGGEGGGGAGATAGSGGEGGEPTVAVCGDGLVTPPEKCDDGNTNDGDRCAARCDCDGKYGDASVFSKPELGKCYVLKSTIGSWSPSRGYCTAIGMDFAAITSKQESSLIAQFLTGDAWIGGEDLKDLGKWVWENGEPWTIYPCDGGVSSCDNNILLWSPGEPNTKDKERCIGVHVSGQLFDLPCEESLRTLCETLQ